LVHLVLLAPWLLEIVARYQGIVSHFSACQIRKPGAAKRVLLGGNPLRRICLWTRKCHAVTLLIRPREHVEELEDIQWRLAQTFAPIWRAKMEFLIQFNWQQGAGYSDLHLHFHLLGKCKSRCSNGAAPRQPEVSERNRAGL